MMYPYELLGFADRLRELFKEPLLNEIHRICESAPSWKTYWELGRMYIEARKSELRCPFDWNAAIVIYPGDLSGKLWYGQYFWQQNRYTEILFEQPEVQEYQYFDNTNRPEHISEPEWDKRRENWLQLVPNETPALSGFCIQLAGPYLPWPRKETSDMIKTHEDQQ